MFVVLCTNLNQIHWPLSNKIWNGFVWLINKECLLHFIFFFLEIKHGGAWACHMFLPRRMFFIISMSALSIFPVCFGFSIDFCFAFWCLHSATKGKTKKPRATTKTTKGKQKYKTRVRTFEVRWHKEIEKYMFLQNGHITAGRQPGGKQRILQNVTGFIQILTWAYKTV